MGARISSDGGTCAGGNARKGMQGTLASRYARPAGVGSLLEWLVGSDFYRGFLRFFRDGFVLSQLNVFIGYRVHYWWRNVWFLRAGSPGGSRRASQLRNHAESDYMYNHPAYARGERQVTSR